MSKKTIIELVNAGIYDNEFLFNLSNGHSYKEIAQIMGFNNYMMNIIIKHLYHKYNAVNNASLMYKAIKAGFLNNLH